MARTGSGKTAAFVIPMIERLKTHQVKIWLKREIKVGSRALILSPNRELALQTFKVVKELKKGTNLKAVLLVGGEKLEEQFEMMSANPDIIVATPGRFLHLKVEMDLNLKTIEYIVFDEADRLFEMGFSKQLSEILHYLPASRQSCLFSATLPKSLVEFAKADLQNPVLVRLDFRHDGLFRRESKTGLSKIKHIQINEHKHFPLDRQYDNNGGFEFFENHDEYDINNLSEKIKTLKDITISIGYEIRDSSVCLSSMNESFFNTKYTLHGIMKNMKRMTKRQNITWFHFLLFILVRIILYPLWLTSSMFYRTESLSSGAFKQLRTRIRTALKEILLDTLIPRKWLLSVLRIRFLITFVEYSLTTFIYIFCLSILPCTKFLKIIIFSSMVFLLFFPFTRPFFRPSLPIASWLILFYACRFIPSSIRPRIWVTVLPALENIVYGASLTWIPYGIIHFGAPFVTAIIVYIFSPPGTLPVFAKRYENLYGNQPANYTMEGSAGGLARIDGFFGTKLYTTAFPASPLVFGAFPSLHAGHATLEALFLSRIFPKTAPYFVIYVLWLWWCTMYLTHHYFVDLIGGSCLAVFIFYIAHYNYLPHIYPKNIFRWDYHYSIFDLSKTEDLEIPLSHNAFDQYGSMQDNIVNGCSCSCYSCPSDSSPACSDINKVVNRNYWVSSIWDEKTANYTNTSNLFCNTGNSEDIDIDLQEEAQRISRMNIVVCTPGRILQHIDQTFGFDINNLQILVLDEADCILDMGFQKTIDAIIENIPKNRQTLLFSATQTKNVKDLSRISLKNPDYIAVHEKEVSSTPPALLQYYSIVLLPNKISTLFGFLRTHLKAKILVFMSTSKQVRFIYETFRRLQPGIPLLHLYGRKKQTSRNLITAQFSAAKHVAMFCTDIAARGLDFPMVDWVLQFDCPENADTYIHRVGRTARFDKNGKALMFISPSEMKLLEYLEKKKVKIQEIKIKDPKVIDISKKLQYICFKDPEIKYLGQKACLSYLRSIYLQKDKEIFKFEELSIEELSSKMGLLDGKIQRLRSECPHPTCGAGIFMALHKDRRHCGKCGLTMVFSKRD
ncbi:hypothetical protein PCK2_000139 [Pneumocystis canis]|nr:hypothetical protein PCK2_000139 [Pneumocystis canis]